jgi:ATP-dependent Lon protease
MPPSFMDEPAPLEAGSAGTGSTLLLPVLSLKDVCLFPGASLSLVVSRPGTIAALEMAGRSGRSLVAVAQRDPNLDSPASRDLHTVGTLAQLSEDLPLADGGRRVELDGVRRGRVITFVGGETMVAEVHALAEGEPGDHWGPAVEALARYLHAHPDLRSFLDQQRRSKEPMAWVNLACQHLPITSSARQKLLEADAVERCLKIGRGLDALLRKELGA